MKKSKEIKKLKKEIEFLKRQREIEKSIYLMHKIGRPTIVNEYVLFDPFKAMLPSTLSPFNCCIYR